MKLHNSIKTAIAALCFGTASHVMATTITLNATGVPSYLNNNAYQGTFDASALLPGHFAINSIGFTFTFADDATDSFSTFNGTPVTTSSVLNSQLSGGNMSVTTTTTVTNPVTHTGEQESVVLSFGSASFSGATAAGAPVIVSNTVSGSPVQGSVTYAKNNGEVCTAAQAAEKNSACKTIYHYTVTNTVTKTATTDYTGNIVLADSLLNYADLLAELSQNKMLNFGLGATGDLNLVTASLNLDYTETTAQPSNNVPEPGSLALFGIAVFGIAGARRARRR